MANKILSPGAFSIYDPYYRKKICPEMNSQALRLVAISSWNNMGHTEKMHPLFPFILLLFQQKLLYRF